MRRKGYCVIPECNEPIYMKRVPLCYSCRFGIKWAVFITLGATTLAAVGVMRGWGWL